MGIPVAPSGAVQSANTSEGRLSMQCREVRDFADSFLSEQLLVETNHEVLRHLDGCPGCRSEMASRRALRATIQRAFTNAESLRMRDEFRDGTVSRLRAIACP